MQGLFYQIFSGGQYKPRSTETLMFARLRSNVIFSLLQMTYDWDGGNVFGWLERCRGWGTTASQISMLKSPGFKTNTGVL